MNFKAGDWVRDTREGMRKPIAQLKENCIALTHPEEHAKHFVLWQPKEGEWCWFYKEAYIKHTDLRQFRSKGDEGYITMDFSYYTTCEPFIGQLPSFINLT